MQFGGKMHRSGTILIIRKRKSNSDKFANGSIVAKRQKKDKGKYSRIYVRLLNNHF
jgi:hypothetical protein